MRPVLLLYSNPSADPCCTCSPDLHLLALPQAEPAISVVEGHEEPVGGRYFHTYGQRQPKPDVYVS